MLDTPEGDDATVRPNQIFAVSLPFSPLDRECQAKVVRACGRELLTSYGLRSLSPSDRNFHPYYTGGVWERDGGYHQGPVWAFLLGHYALAEHRITATRQRRRRASIRCATTCSTRRWAAVSEIFDGAPPHTPRGAPSQAWSVACTLEAWWRLEKAKRDTKPVDSEAAAALSRKKPETRKRATA